MINDLLQVQLSDFGLSQFSDASTTSFGSNQGGAVRWLAPEVLTKGLRPTYCSDIYAFGCVWLEVSRCRPLDSNRLITFSIQLCTGSPPFADLKSDLQVISRIMTGSCPTYPLLQNPPV